MKRSVSPRNGRTVPSGAAAVSSRRRLVVPTATTRPPAARAVLIAAAAASADLAALGVHPVAGDLVGADREEGAGADMERDRRPRDAALRERIEQAGGEVQPGGRRGDGAFVAGEDRLVIVWSAGSGPAGRSM